MALKVLWIKILFEKLTNSCKHSLMLAKTGIEVHLMHEFMPPEPFIVFQQRTCPIHYFSSKSHVFEGFAPFCRRTRPVAGTSIGVQLIECLKILCCLQKLVSRCIYCTSLYLQNRFLFSSNEHAQSTTLCPKLMFSKVSHHFVDAPDPLRKLVSACI